MAAASHTQMQQQGVAVLAAVLVPVLVQARFRNDFSSRDWVTLVSTQ